MKPWFCVVPAVVFSCGRYLYVEEILTLAAYLLFSIVWWLAISQSMHELTVPLVVFFSVGIVTCVAIRYLSPRFDIEKNANVESYVPVDYNTLSCSPEISNDEILIDGNTFRDGLGRRVFLRGVNLGGSSKLPHGFTTFDGPSTLVLHSFVGRPLELESAEHHLKILRAAGLVCLRLIVTWEAIEPAREGEYDMAYLDYIRSLVRLCARYGLSIIIDPHQDVWSRWSGGDGAPKWTFEQLGLEPENFHATRAAVMHTHEAHDPHPFPHMAWTTNYLLFAAATMFTLFFAGNDYAPKTAVNGVPAQEWLQGAYIRAIQQLARHLRDERNVLGFEAMNEPHAGWVGRCSAGRPLTEYHAGVPLGWIVSPWDAVRLANGASLDVAVFSAPFVYSHTERANPAGRSAWRAGAPDVWEANGVWGRDARGEPRLLRPDHFACPGGPAAFQTRYLLPFWERFSQAVRAATGRRTLVFTGPALELEAPRARPAAPADRIAGGGQVWAPHWYDVLTLVGGRHRAWLGVDMASAVPLRVGRGPAARAHRRSVAAVAAAGAALGPCALGEVGVPWQGSVRATAAAAEASLAAVEAALLPAVAVWAYTPDHSAARGDGWNGEDLSVYTPERGGGFRVPAAVRPYPRRLAGRPVEVAFDSTSESRPFVLRFVEEPPPPDSAGAAGGGGQGAAGETVVFVPAMHYPDGVAVEVSDGSFALCAALQELTYRHAPGANGGNHSVRLRRAAPPAGGVGGGGGGTKAGAGPSPHQQLPEGAGGGV